MHIQVNQNSRVKFAKLFWPKKSTKKTQEKSKYFVSMCIKPNVSDYYFFFNSKRLFLIFTFTSFNVTYVFIGEAFF